MTMDENLVTNGNKAKEEDMDIFDKQLLNVIDFQNNCVAKFKNGLCPQNPGLNLEMRPLRLSDYDRGYISLLRQLTKCGEISSEMWENQFSKMKSCPNSYYIVTLVDVGQDKIIGSATLHIEWKFIHQCQPRGRIEDVIVDSKYRGQQLGKLLVETMTLLGKHLGCYKLSLDCEDLKIPFYSQFGYVKEDGQNFMLIRIKD